MKKMDTKQGIKFLLLGTGTIWGTALLSPILGKMLPILGTAIPMINLNLAAMLSAGVSAGVVDYLLTTYYE